MPVVSSDGHKDKLCTAEVESIGIFASNSYLSDKDLNVHDQKQAELHFSLECP